MSIGLPYDVKHDMHIDFTLEVLIDIFVNSQGMPDEWVAYLKSQGIHVGDAAKNLPTLKNVMNFNQKLISETPLLSVAQLPEDSSLSLGMVII